MTAVRARIGCLRSRDFNRSSQKKCVRQRHRGGLLAETKICRHEIFDRRHETCVVMNLVSPKISWDIFQFLVCLAEVQDKVRFSACSLNKPQVFKISFRIVSLQRNHLTLY